MPEDIASNIPDAGRAFIGSRLHCACCRKTLLEAKDGANFIVAFWSGKDPKTGEPIIRDGIFDENAKLAIMKACPVCGKAIKALHEKHKKGKLGDLYGFPDGPLKKMLQEISPRTRANWNFEIGWMLLIPMAKKIRDKKIGQRLLMPGQEMQ